MTDPSLLAGNLDSTPQINAATASKASSRQRSRWLLGLGVIGLLLAIGTPIIQSQLAAQETETTAANAANPLAVETLTVEAVDRYTVSRAYTGEIAALQSSDLGFTRGDELVQVFVEEGDRVSIGQPLAQLDTQNLLTQRRQAQRAEMLSRLSRTMSELNLSQSSRKLAWCHIQETGIGTCLKLS